MIKVLIALLIICMVFSISCNDDNVITDLEFEDFIYPLEDGAWWTHMLQNPLPAKSRYDSTYIAFLVNGNYEHPAAGTSKKLEYYHFDEQQDDWILSQTIYVKAQLDSVFLYLDDSATHNLMLLTSAEVGDEWQVNPDVTGRIVSRGNYYALNRYFENCFKILYSDSLSSGLIMFPSRIGGFGIRISTTALSLISNINDLMDYEETILYKLGSYPPYFY